MHINLTHVERSLGHLIEEDQVRGGGGLTRHNAAEPRLQGGAPLVRRGRPPLSRQRRPRGSNHSLPPPPQNAIVVSAHHPLSRHKGLAAALWKARRARAEQALMTKGHNGACVWSGQAPAALCHWRPAPCISDPCARPYSP
jgi:hypothetical protein